jgi:uncharacterized membrane protein YeiH
MCCVSGTLQSVIEVVAVGAFAYSGADLARRHGMDIVGLAALAVINGLAGGIVRDVSSDHAPMSPPLVAAHMQPPQTDDKNSATRKFFVESR